MKCAKWILGLLVTIMPLLATAQLQDNETIWAQVPFKFMVGSKTIPAGECVIKRAATDSKTLLINNASASVSLFSSVFPLETKTISGNYILIFHVYGERYFLTGLQLKGDRTIYQFPESKAEAEMRAQNLPVAEETLLASVK
ncbi:MAG TPA: hypothetical protein VEI52_13050 [Terriglobales bacterium]|nr:hypothetical protein [Terriglobales bacterium]